MKPKFGNYDIGRYKKLGNRTEIRIKGPKLGNKTEIMK